MYRDTLLAWRARPGSYQKLAFTMPAALVVAAAVALLALYAFLPPYIFSAEDLAEHRNSSLAAGLILLFFALLAVGASLGIREVPNVPEPMPEGDVGYAVGCRFLRLSPSRLERAHSFVGWLYGTGRRVAVLLHEELEKVHTLIIGGTKRNKTTRGLLPRLVQRLQRGNCTVVLLNLKGGSEWEGNASFWILEEAARALGIPFYFFTDIKERASHLLRLLDNPACARMSDNQLAQGFCAATGLEHGEGFGTGYYGAMAELLFKRLIQVLRSSGRALTPARLLRLVSNRAVRKEIGMTRRDFENASHVIPILDRLACDPRLNMTPDHPVAASLLEYAITPDKAIRGPAVIYIELHAQLEPTTVRLLPRLFLRQLIAELMTWKGDRVGHIYFAIDEAGEMLQRSLLTPIKQARSLDLSFDIVCQNLSDLKRDDFDLTDPVLGNTAVKIMFSADERAREYLKQTGGEKVVQMLSEQTSTTESERDTSRTLGKSRRDTAVPVWGSNEVNQLNARSEYAIFEASPMSGFTRFEGPVLVEIPFSMSSEQFQEYDDREWPEPDGVRTVRASDLPPAEPDDPAPALTTTPPPPDQPRREKRRRPPKPVDPEEVRRAEALAETLREMRGEL
jgi:hypothetical protein